MTVGEKIRTAREEKRLSQREVAANIPMNQSNYSKLERNLQEPSMAQLRRICQILELDPRVLLELEIKECPPPADADLLADLCALVDRYRGK